MTALPLFADDRRAAGLLCLPVREFRRLVQEGALPRPVRIAEYERWDVEQLRAVARGQAAQRNDDLEV